MSEFYQPAEYYFSKLALFLGVDGGILDGYLAELRDLKWKRWGGGTVEVSVGEILYCLVRLRNPKKVFEAGTNWGYSTANIALALKQNSVLPSTLLNGPEVVKKFDRIVSNYDFVSCDIDSSALVVAGSYLKDCGLKSNVVLLKHDSIELVSKIPGIDFAFIDSSHEYGYTKKEFEAIIKKADRNVMLVFHDAYTYTYGVRNFLSELDPKEWKQITLPTQPETGLGVVIRNEV